MSRIWRSVPISFLFLLVPFAFLFAADENITITTYYPSPYGVYKTMLLSPGPKAGSCSPGQMVYDSNLATEGYYVCDITSSTWQPLGFGGNGTDPYWAANPLDPASIYNTNAGNVMVGTPNNYVNTGKLVIPWLYYGWGPQGGAECGFIYSHGGGLGVPAGGSLGLGANGQTNQVVSDGAGRVGIGTTNPAAQLQVNGTVQLGDLGVSSVGIEFNSAPSSLPTWPCPRGNFQGGRHTLLVGLPAKVQTLYYGRWNADGTDTDAVNGYYGIGFSKIIQTGAAPWYQLGYGYSLPATPMFYIAGGNVSINTTNTTSFRLQVNGSVGPSVPNAYNLGSPVLRWQNIWGTFSGPSDARMKANITDTPLGTDFVMKLRPVQFNWKARADGKYQGFIAQELEKVIQDSGIEFAGLMHDKTNDTYSLAYTELIAPMIKMVQENQKLIETLKTKVKELKARTALDKPAEK